MFKYLDKVRVVIGFYKGCKGKLTKEIDSNKLSGKLSYEIELPQPFPMELIRTIVCSYDEIEKIEN